MIQNRTAEIRSFLSHGDVSLAIRRMLDLALDTANEDLIRQSIAWSKKYRQQMKEQEQENLPDPFYAEANLLLDQLSLTQGDFGHRRESLLQANNVSKTYSKGNFSLQPISVSLSTGDIIGVVGENGNGKTTLLRCLSGQLALNAGHIAYPQLQQPDHYAIKHHLAFIPQRIPRWYGLLKDNLHFSASLSGIRGRQNELMVDFMLERLNLSPYANLTWNQISSGYRTRFEIARVLLQKPSLLILDEPLANLDIKAQQTILTDLRYLAKSVYHPMGIMLSSQQLHEVEKIADTVLFIRSGKCLYRTGETEAVQRAVLEVETAEGRERLLEILGPETVHVHFNGGYYTITSTNLSVNEMVYKMVSGGVQLTYFRDITHSTKRFF
ncbi:MAG TPA: ABC transporter ATP-binding protein [Chitinophagaceae bacterium]|nr:ABC transporter ATP-binding protein [Chitinophagaceae bacterium]